MVQRRSRIALSHTESAVEPENPGVLMPPPVLWINFTAFNSGCKLGEISYDLSHILCITSQPEIQDANVGSGVQEPQVLTGTPPLTN